MNEIDRFVSEVKSKPKSTFFPSIFKKNKKEENVVIK